MKARVFGVAAAVTAAGVLPSHALLVIAGGIGALALLVYAGIALPSVWSAKPARRKAASAILCQILATLRRG
jgi:hypothetical protein